MIAFITAEELASLLETTVTAGLTLIVDLVNETVEEAWQNPTEQIPARVKAVALTVGARAAANPKGLTSWTRSWDDVSRTERMEGGSRRLGVYLTDDELAELNGAPDKPTNVGSIRLRIATPPC
jgi:hypothetical protein